MKETGERSDAVETDQIARPLDRFTVRQKPLGVFDADVDQILMGRLAIHRFEEPNKMELGETRLV